MIFPIGDDNVVGGHKPLLSYSLIIINILVFIYEIRLGNHVEQFIIQYGMIPAEVSTGHDYFTLISSMFLHGSWMHLIGNMLFLWIFADNIEAIIGSARFALFYFLGGVFASLVHILFDPGSLVPAVGASGAISAVMGTYIVMFPRSKIRLIFIIFLSRFEVPAILFLGFWFLQQLMSGIGTVGEEHMSGVAWWAHIGGFIYGLVAALIIKSRFGHHYKYGA